MAENTEFVNLTFRAVGAETVRKELASLSRDRALSQVARDAAAIAGSGDKARTATIRLRGELSKMGATSKEVSKVVKEYDRLVDASKRAEAAAKSAAIAENKRALEALKAANASDGGGGSGLFGRKGTLRRVGTEVKNLPAIQLAPGISTDVLGKFTSLLGALGPASVVASVGVVALAVALGQAAAATAKLNEETRRRIEAEEEVARFLLDATKKQGRERLNELTRQLGVELDLLAKREAEYFSQINSLNPFDQLRAGAGLAFGEIGAANEAYEEQKKVVDELVLATGELNDALAQGGTAANDLAAAERALAVARQANIDKAIDNQVKLLAQIGNFDTADSVDSRVQSLQDERAALQGAVDAGIASTEQLEQYRQRIIEINGDLSTLQYLIRPVAVEREREAQALRDTETQLKALATAQERFNTDSAALAASLRDSATKNAGTLAKINSDLDKKLVDAANTRAKALVDAERDAINDHAEAIRDRDSAIGEAARKSQIDREKDERQHQQRLQQIQRDFNRSQSQAVADRDSVALQAAEQARDDAITDEKSAYTERLNEIDRALQEENRTINMRYQEQQRTINQRLTEQTQTINQRYSEQVQAAQIAAQQARVAEQQRFAQEQQAIQNQLRLRTNQYNQEIAIASAGAKAILTIEAQKQQLLVAQAQAAYRAISANTSMAPTSTFNRNGTTYTIRANGGPLSSGQASIVNDRDRNQRESYTAGGQTALFPPGMGMFIPAKSGMVNANGGGGATNININLDGKTIQAMSRRMAIQTIDEILTQSGVN